MTADGITRYKRKKPRHLLAIVPMNFSKFWTFCSADPLLTPPFNRILKVFGCSSQEKNKVKVILVRRLLGQ